LFPVRSFELSLINSLNMLLQLYRGTFPAMAPGR
jgi:hypothetical protein